MTYPDEILVDLSKRFNDAHWGMLSVLGTRLENGSVELLPYEALSTPSIKEIEHQINLSPQYFRQHMAFLQGAGAIAIVGHPADGRAKGVQLTANGYRMMQLELQGGK